MPTSVPAAVPSDGMVSLKWVPSITDRAAPKLTEVNATAALALECYLKESFSPAASEEAVTDRRMCSKQVFEDYGTITKSIDELVAIYDVQNASSESNKAYAALVPGATGFLVARWGKDVDTPWAVGDKVDVYPVRMGARRKMPPEENSQLQFTIKPYVTGPVNEDVALVA